jgi:hypothetical protein
VILVAVFYREKLKEMNMFSILNKSVLIFIGFIMLMFSLSACKTTQSGTSTILTGTYYARCNLKVLKGKYITWVNWQAAPTYIPVNTELRVKNLELVPY